MNFIRFKLRAKLHFDTSVLVSLFGGIVQATPDQITKEIADDVDSMIKEIAGCSEAIRNFAFGLFYNFVLAW